MSERPDPAERSALDELRDELGDQFASVAGREQRKLRRGGVRPLLVVVIALLALAPGAVALAGGFDGKSKTHTIVVSNSTVMVDGKPIDCPASFVELKKLGKDPCDPALLPRLISVTGDGRKIHCPTSLSLLDKRGEDPCDGSLTTAAPAPALSPASPCPDWVKEFLRATRHGETKLSDYPKLPGYPFKTCPSAEQLAPLIGSSR